MGIIHRPSVIGNRYELHQEIGHGGMGVVYRATDHLTGQTVALKLVNPDLSRLAVSSRSGSSTNVRLALAQEFKTLASLRHPHIIDVLDYGFTASRQPFYTMELLEYAQNLLQAARGLPVKQQVEFLIQILQALAYLHRRGVIHRDLKPGNVLVTMDNQVKVVDFGLSITRGKVPEGGKSEEVVGTLAYMAPEILRGELPDEAADLYAAGMMAYEMFAGQHPFHIDDFTRLVHEIMTVEPDVELLSVNPELQNILKKLTAKNPAERFQSIHQLIYQLSDAAHLPQPHETVEIRESYLQAADFVGRDAELQQLLEAFQKAQNGQGSAWLVGAESGLGKSRLLDELRIRALIQGALVLRGQAVEEGRLPYHIWRDVLRRLLISIEMSDTETGVLKEIVPDIEKLLARPVPDVPALTGQAHQQRLSQTIVDLFQRLQTPTVLLLEDLQWTGLSLAPLKELIPIVSNLPLLIVGSYRSDEAPDLSRQLPGTQVIMLERLDKDAITQLSASILGETGKQPHVTRFLQRESEGNVFFLVEVVRALAEEAGHLHEVGGMTLPAYMFAGGVAQVIRRRLSHVPLWGQDLLKLAAVAGRRLDLKLLQFLEPYPPLELWLDTCLNAAVLMVQENTWFFAHDKLRQAVLHDLTDYQRVTLHQRVAEAIESLYPDDHEPALAYHWSVAGNQEKEFYYAAQAGMQALVGGDFPKAKNYLERALALQPDLQQPPALSLAWLTCQLAETCYGLGDYAQAKELLQKSISLAAHHPAALARSYNLLGNIALALGDYAEGQQHLEKAIQVAQENRDTLEKGKAMRSLGVILMTVGNRDRAKQVLQESLTLLASDPPGTAGALTNLAQIAHDEGNYPTARRLLESGLERFESINFQWGIAYTLTVLGNTVSAIGDYEKAQEYHKRAIAICQNIRHQWGLAYTLLNLADACLLANQPQDARTSLTESLRISLEIQTVPLSLDILTRFAKLVSPEQAVTLLAFVLAHPRIENDTRARASQEMESLKNQLPAQLFEISQQRGQHLSLEHAAQLAL